MMRARMPATAIAALAALALTACRADPQPAAAPIPAEARFSPAGLELVPLGIRSGGITHQFTVELARSPAQQEQGMMFRQSLGDREGMLFPFEPPRPASFWMKNTLIPLDMIFIRPDGTIARIAANAVPHSLEPVQVGEPLAAVLELRGGRSAELGIREGDRVGWPGGPSL